MISDPTREEPAAGSGERVGRRSRRTRSADNLANVRDDLSVTFACVGIRFVDSAAEQLGLLSRSLASGSTGEVGRRPAKPPAPAVDVFDGRDADDPGTGVVSGSDLSAAQR